MYNSGNLRLYLALITAVILPSQLLRSAIGSDPEILSWRCPDRQSLIAVTFDDVDFHKLYIKNMDSDVSQLNTKENSTTKLFSSKNMPTKRSMLIRLKDHLVSADYDGVDFWNEKTGEVIHQQFWEGQRLATILKSPHVNEILLATYDRDKSTVFTFKVGESGLEHKKILVLNRLDKFRDTKVAMGRIYGIAQSPEGKSLLISFQEGYGSVLLDEHKTLNTHYVGDDHEPCHALAINEDPSEWLISARHSISILTEPRHLATKASLDFPNSRILEASLSPDREKIAVAPYGDDSQRTSLFVLDAKTLRVTKQIDGADWGYAEDLCWAQDSSAVALVTGETTIRLVKVSD